MRKNVFTLIGAALLGTTAWAQVTSLPFTSDFEESTAPFDAGTVVNATDVGNVLNVSNTTATATFNIGGWDSYDIEEEEEVTVSFDAMHGWVGTAGQTTTISLLNSDGVALISYTYDINATQVTDVSFAGQTVAGFEKFMGQANFNNNKSANGYSHNQHYVLTENYTPKVTMKVHGLGTVKFSFKYMAAKSKNIDVNYSANLEGVTMDLAKIVITDGCTNADRSFCMDNLSISTEQKALYKYVINYVDVDDNDKVVKTVEGAAEEGTMVAIDDAPVWADGVKYYVLSNDSQEKAVDTSNATVITVRCQKAALYSYTVTATDGTSAIASIASGQNYEGETVGYPYPRYINVEGTLYKKDPIDQVYNGTFLLDQDNMAIDVEYAATTTTNVICLLEAEDVDGLTICNTSTVADRCSQRAGAWTATDAKLVTLTPGTYTLIAAAYGGTYTFKVGESEVLNIAQAGSWRENTSEVFTITENTDLTFVGGSGTAGSLDYIVLQSEDGNIVSAIKDTADKQAAAVSIFNLQGQRVEKAQRGLFIIRSAEGRLQGKNGRKLMVK